VVNQILPTDLCDYRLDVQGGSCRPVLDITQTAPNRVLLDWTTAAIGYHWRERTILAIRRTRSGAGDHISTISSSRFHVTDPMVSSNQFYQLRKP